MKRIGSMLMGLAVGLLAPMAEASAPINLYTLTDTTVTDTLAKLTWQRMQLDQPISWEAAKTYCQNLNLDGFGWRLPRKKELEQLVDRRANPYGPAIDAKAFPGTTDDRFWTSTPAASDNTKAWVVDFYRGNTDFKAKSEEWWVRCVRG